MFCLILIEIEILIWKLWFACQYDECWYVGESINSFGVMKIRLVWTGYCVYACWFYQLFCHFCLGSFVWSPKRIVKGVRSEFTTFIFELLLSGAKLVRKNYSNTTFVLSTLFEIYYGSSILYVPSRHKKKVFDSTSFYRILLIGYQVQVGLRNLV